jgi:hypothetical protein
MEKNFESPQILTIDDTRGIHVKDANGNPLYQKQKTSEAQRKNAKGELLYLKSDGAETTVAIGNTAIMDTVPVWLDAKGAETTNNTGVPAMADTIERIGIAKVGVEVYVRKSPVILAKLLGKETVVGDSGLEIEARIELQHADGKTSEMWKHRLPYADNKDLTDDALLDLLLTNYDLK